MIHIIKAHERYVHELDWLKTYWLFSFSDYYDPQNTHFGALRVFNDDVVEPGAGFPSHPHRDMEIITLVLSGELTHEDDMGNRVVVGTGEVQSITAGTGMMHSEFNHGKRPVHLYQIWIHPRDSGLEPAYDQRAFHTSSRRNRLLPVASGQGVGDGVTIQADATIYLADLDPEQAMAYRMGKHRKLFLYVTRGEVEVNRERLNQNDQARIEGEDRIELSGGPDSVELILIDVP